MLRLAEAARYRYRYRYRYQNDARNFSGIGDERLATDPAYNALVTARNDAQWAVIATDPKVPTPKKVKAKK